jgi:hypothetical protein
MFKSLLLNILGFLLIFRPDIGLNVIFIHILFVCVCALLLLEKKITIIKDRYINGYFLICCFLFFYSLAFSLLKTSDFSRPYLIFILVVEVYVCTYYLSSKLSERYNCPLDIYKFLLKVGGIQMVFVFLTLFIPSFREFILSLSRIENILEISNWGDVAIRTFGFGSAYTSTLPAFLAVCMGAAVLLYFIERNGWYLLVLPIFVVGIVLNARSPMVVFLLLLGFLLLPSIKFKSSMFFFIFTLSSLIIGLAYISVGMDDVQNSSVKRLLEGVKEVESLLDGNTTGTFTALSSMFTLPNNLLEIMFGTGINVFVGNELHYHSDSGYIIDIYTYGLFGLLMHLFAISFIYIRGVIFYNSIEEKKHRMFLQFFWGGLFLSYLVLHIKGSVFYINEITITILLISFFNYFNSLKLRGDQC